MASYSKQKGGEFERQVCKTLSLWVSDGKRKDLFWRSAMSGGRATIAGKGELSRQCGDICAISPEGHKLTDPYYIECKFLKDLQMRWFMIGVGGRDSLLTFWRQTCEQAKQYKKKPMLIARQNNFPTLVLCHTPSVRNSYRDVMITWLDIYGARDCDIILLNNLVKMPFDAWMPK